MKILLSNDDGYQAEGLLALYNELQDAHDLTVIAPDKNCSGFSSALTLHKKIKVERMPNGFYVLHGTPADCVHFAVNGVLDFQPDLIISGINNGENLASDVIYSGTVGAAIEGRFQTFPAVAISLIGRKLKHYESAAKVAHDLVNKLQDETLPSDMILNINVPDVSYNRLGGYQVAQLGYRSRPEPIIHCFSEKGADYYCIGGNGLFEGEAGSDFLVINQNKISITPLSIDMTDYRRMQLLSDWFK